MAAACWLLLLGGTHAVRLGGTHAVRAHAVAPVSLAPQRCHAPLMVSTEQALTEIEQMVSKEVTPCLSGPPAAHRAPDHSPGPWPRAPSPRPLTWATHMARSCGCGRPWWSTRRRGARTARSARSCSTRWACRTPWSSSTGATTARQCRRALLAEPYPEPEPKPDPEPEPEPELEPESAAGRAARAHAAAHRA